ncbi:retrovirus-related pol polyprotein from transposon TNT 1-94 [Tanacetum coccineum]
MQEELNQFIANDVWELVPQPKNMTIIGTKWVFRNKLYKNGIVSRNKARLVTQGYNQQEGIDYDENYAPVARLESIKILLAYACALDFKLFQMDVKSAFLNDFINEKVYVAQPLGFIDFEKPDHVYKLKKDLYGLKKASKAWYDRLKSFLIKHEYKMGMVDNTLFTKKKSSNLIIVQIYVDDIIFSLTCQNMCDEFAKIMHDEFEMSMIEMLKKFGLEDSKLMKTPMSSDTKLMKDEECESVDSTKYPGMIGTTHLGLWYPKGTGIKTVVYSDSDHAGDYVDQKSTSGACVFTDRWRLDELAYGIPLDGPYQTNPPSIEEIISSIRIDREGHVRRIRHEKEINVLEYQVLTREIEPTLKPLEEVIQENVFCLGARLLLPYGMLLTRLFTFIMNEYPELNNESYVLYDRVMTLLAAQLERKPRRDRGMRRGRHSTSSSAFDQPSLFHLNDDDDYGNDEGTSRATTPSPVRYVNSLTDQVP